MKKKLFAAILAMTVALSTVACGETSAEVTSGETSASTETSVEKAALDTSNVVLSEYKGLTVSVDKKEVTDALAEYYAQYFFNSLAKDMTWNIAAENGHTVVIDFVGKKDGVAFDGGTSENYSLTLGSHAFIDGFEDGLIGIKPGETRDLDLTFPENYTSEELAGQAVVFTVTCKNVIPTMTDENVAALQDANYTDVASMTEYCRKLLEVYYEQDYQTNVVTAVLDIVIANSTIPVPDALLAEKSEYVNSVYAEDAAAYGLDVATYLSYYGTTVQEIAVVFAQRDLIFKKIGELEGFTFTDEEVDEYAKGVLEAAGLTTPLEEEYATNSRESYRDEMLMEKVYKLILECTNVEPATVAEKTEDVSGSEDVSQAE